LEFGNNNVLAPFGNYTFRKQKYSKVKTANTKTECLFSEQSMEISLLKCKRLYLKVFRKKLESKTYN